MGGENKKGRMEGRGKEGEGKEESRREEGRRRVGGRREGHLFSNYAGPAQLTGTLIVAEQENSGSPAHAHLTASFLL